MTRILQNTSWKYIACHFLVMKFLRFAGETIDNGANGARSIEVEVYLNMRAVPFFIQFFEDD